MQKTRTAACSLFLIVLFSAASAVGQNASHSSKAISRGPAMAIEKINKRPAEATLWRSVKEHERLLTINPSDPVIMNNLGAFYFLSGRYYEAQSLIRKAANLAPNLAQIQMNLAIAQNQVFNPDLAVKTLETLLAAQPDQMRARTLLCDLYGQQVRNEEAASCYETVLRSQKSEAVTASNFGTVLLALNKIDRAVEVLKSANELFPNDPGVINGLGVALFHKKKYSQAEEHLQRAVELLPDAAQLRFNLAMTQMMTRKKSSVLEQYNYLKSADPELAGRLYKMIFSDKLVHVDVK